MSYSLVLAVLLVGALSKSTTAQPSASSVSPRAAVQAFYDWYTPLANNSRGRAWDDALRQRPQLFGDSLRRELAADATAAAHSREIVGIDWDPFLNSQDPCERYEVGALKGAVNRIEAPVYMICSGTRNTVPVVSVVLTREGDRWVMSNFVSSDETDLLSSLRRLRAEREAPRRAPPHDGW